MDHGGAKARAVAAVLLVDVLDHLLAPLVLEVDVDVGGLLALLEMNRSKRRCVAPGPRR
jgi:hypothetical protein